MGHAGLEAGRTGEGTRSNALVGWEAGWSIAEPVPPGREPLTRARRGD